MKTKKSVFEYVKYILLAAVPILITNAAIFASSQIGQLIVSTKYIKETGTTDQMELYNYLIDYLQGDNLMKLIMIGHVVSFIIVLLILVKGLKEKAFGNPLKAFPNLTFPGILLTAAGLEMLLTGTLNLIQLLAPGALDNYNQLVSKSGMAGFTVISTIATCLIAPLNEETAYRGFATKLLEKTGWKFWVVNVIQALFFGISHLNFVQGAYAFVMGIFLGYVMHRCKSLWAAVLAHGFFNFVGTYGVAWVYGQGDVTIGKVSIVMAIAAIVLAGGIFMLVHRKEEAVVNE